MQRDVQSMLAPPDRFVRRILPQCLGKRRTVVRTMQLLPDDGNCAIRINLTNTVNSRIGSHPAPDNKVFMMFHDRFLCKDMKPRLKIDPLLCSETFDVRCCPGTWRNSVIGDLSNRSETS